MYTKKEEVREARFGKAGQIVFNARGPNLLTRVGFDSISRILDRYEADTSIHALEFTGANGHFCGGLDLRWMQTLQQSSKTAREAADYFYAIGLRIAEFPKPTFAFIEDGYCSGVGAEIAASCDYIVAMKKNAPRIVFAALAPQLAFMIGLGITWRFSRKIGVPNTARFLTKTAPTDLFEAVKLGIVDALFWGDDPVKEMEYFVDQVLEGEIPKRVSPRPTANIARLTPEEREALSPGCPLHTIYRILAAVETCSQAPTLAEAMEMEKHFFLELFLSGDAKEGIAARLEGRVPKFCNNVITTVCG
ncbi:MAG: enoyl-CoA hydratase/isomerase family protein [Parcubacteria group bacterium]|nr:enoyl-CoA hydratase/isomerase family protein [Parcubacteria group bacterium]